MTFCACTQCYECTPKTKKYPRGVPHRGIRPFERSRERPSNAFLPNNKRTHDITEDDGCVLMTWPCEFCATRLGVRQRYYFATSLNRTSPHGGGGARWRDACSVQTHLLPIIVADAHAMTPLLGTPVAPRFPGRFVASMHARVCLHVCACVCLCVRAL